MFNLIYTDWLFFHDQSMLGCYCNTILGDKETRDGKNASGTCKIYFIINTCIEYQQLGANNMLC